MDDQAPAGRKPGTAPLALVTTDGPRRVRRWAARAFAMALLSATMLLASGAAAKAVEVVDPLLEETTETVDPVVETVAPVFEAVDPIAEETKETVTETADPVIEITDPVMEKATEAVTETVDPVVKTVKGTADPVMEVVDPVLEDAIGAVGDSDIGSSISAGWNRSHAATGTGRSSSLVLDVASDRSWPGRAGTLSGASRAASSLATARPAASPGSSAETGLRFPGGTASSDSTNAPIRLADAGASGHVLALMAILALSARLFLPSIRSSLAPSVAALNVAALALSVERPG